MLKKYYDVSHGHNGVLYFTFNKKQTFDVNMFINVEYELEEYDS